MSALTRHTCATLYIRTRTDRVGHTSCQGPFGGVGPRERARLGAVDEAHTTAGARGWSRHGRRGRRGRGRGQERGGGAASSIKRDDSGRWMHIERLDPLRSAYLDRRRRRRCRRCRRCSGPGSCLDGCGEGALHAAGRSWDSSVRPWVVAITITTIIVGVAVVVVWRRRTRQRKGHV